MTDTTEDRADHTEVVIGLFEPGVADDPHPAYARLRSECPVARGDMGGLPVAMISRYEDVQWALRHPETFTSAGGLDLGEQPLLPLEVDPPVHTDYRRILNPRFTPKAIATCSSRRCAGWSASSSTGSPGGARATSTPSWPRRCRRASSSRSWVCPSTTCRSSSSGATTRSGPTSSRATSRAPQRIRDEAGRAISDYFRDAIAERRGDPDDSLLSLIVHADVRRPALQRGASCSA